MNPTLTLPISWRMFLAIGLAMTVATAAHEVGHHLVAAVECGGFGRMTFTRFQERDGCRAIIGNISGPTISFAILWLGFIWLRRPGMRLLGMAAVIASAPLLRLFSITSGGDDWNYSARLLTGNRHIPDLTALVVIIMLPPLVVAYRALANRRPWLLFPLALLLSLFPAAILQPIDVRYFFMWIDHREAFTQPTVLGIPVIVAIVYGVAAVVFWFWALPVLRDVSVEGSGKNE